MPRIVITHAIQDRDRWLAGSPERVAAAPGARNVTDLLALDGSHQAALALDVDDVDAFLTMVAAMPPDVAAQADAHGVVLPMTVYVQA